MVHRVHVSISLLLSLRSLCGTVRHVLSNVHQVKAFLPVRQSYDFHSLLRQETQGRAFASSMTYSHMQVGLLLCSFGCDCFPALLSFADRLLLRVGE